MIVLVLLCLMLSALPVHVQIIRDVRPTVRLPQGQIVGSRIYGDSRKILDVYYGIPYASAPVGNLRFSPPQRHMGWNQTFEALAPGRGCPQLPPREDQNDSEDCLFLNIWVPENALRFGPVPVVILLEGVDFARTNKVAISGQELTMEGVLVVSVTYRLNIFGFLSLGTSELRGNYGLIDQYFAMIWIKQNIQYFGGDPEKITLLGYSSGAASIMYHLVSPRTAGLFQRVILSSGSAFSPWHSTNNFIASQRVIRILGCWSSYNRTMLQCLRSKSTQDILRAYEEYTESGNFPEMFLPVVDTFLGQGDRYLPVEPSDALREGAYSQVSIMTGISRPVSDPQYKQWTDLASQGFVHLQQFFEQSKIPEVVKRYGFDRDNREEIAEIMKWHYVSTTQGDTRKLLDQLKLFEFEAKIEAPHFMQLNSLVATFVQPIFVYYLEDIGFVLNNTDSTLTTDLLLLFGPLLLNQMGVQRFNSLGQRLSSKLKQLWINFIMFGNPTPNNNMKQWRRYISNDHYIETFDTSGRIEDEVAKSKRVLFWTQLLPKLSNLRSVSMDSNELHSSPDPAAGFKHAMYTLIGLVIALLALLLVCVVLLKRRSKESERHLHMGY